VQMRSCEGKHPWQMIVVVVQSSAVMRALVETYELWTDHRKCCLGGCHESEIMEEEDANVGRAGTRSSCCSLVCDWISTQADSMCVTKAKCLIS
jgi:hypothetical protein